MNDGELITRERMAIVLLVLFLLAAVFALGLLYARGAGQPEAPQAAPAPPPPGPPPSPGSGGGHPSGSGGGSTPAHGGSGTGASGEHPSAGSTGGGHSSPDGTGQPSPPPQSSPPPPSFPPGKPAPAMPFRISGNVPGLEPGATTAISLTLTNPNSVQIQVTRVTVAVSAESSPPGCSSAKNLVLHQATGIRTAAPVVIPARSSVTLTTFPRAPKIGVRDLQTSQDVCKGKSFRLTYTGSAHS